MEIKANYAAMDVGQDGLLGAWNRIDALLLELDAAVLATGDMEAQALAAYQALKAQWSTGAADRQVALKSLSDHVGAARDHYRQVDQAMATMFQHH